MKRVLELEVWSSPGRLLPPEFAKEVLQVDVWNAGVPRDVFLGVSEIPDPIDSEVLKCAFVRGEASESAFVDFCKENGLTGNVDSTESAARYLEYLHGRCLAWLHLPEGPSQARLLAKIEQLMAERGYRIVDRPPATATSE